MQTENINIEMASVSQNNDSPEIVLLKASLASAQLDAQEFRKLAAKNEEEANALRKAAGVSCDDTVTEAIQKVYQLREIVSDGARMLSHLTGSNLETYARTYAALAKAAL